jgi:hypothetical protein
MKYSKMTEFLLKLLICLKNKFFCLKAEFKGKMLPLSYLISTYVSFFFLRLTLQWFNLFQVYFLELNFVTYNAH